MNNKKITTKCLKTAPTREHIKTLKFEIKSCQDSIKRLLAFACGEKQLSTARLRNTQRTEADDRQLFKTIAYLRARIQQFKQDIITLKKTRASQ